MGTKQSYLIAADAVLFIHTAFVAFVVFGLVLILGGKPLRWSWVRNRRFRVLHLAAIGIVVLQSWLSVTCPLTRWEMGLRSEAGDATYPGSFVAHWLETILYYQLPEWMFVLIYTLFGAMVIWSWYWVRPRA